MWMRRFVTASRFDGPASCTWHRCPFVVVSTVLHLLAPPPRNISHLGLTTKPWLQLCGAMVSRCHAIRGQHCSGLDGPESSITSIRHRVYPRNRSATVDLLELIHA